jgi:hypothetical protein
MSAQEYFTNNGGPPPQQQQQQPQSQYNNQSYNQNQAYNPNQGINTNQGFHQGGGDPYSMKQSSPYSASPSYPSPASATPLNVEYGGGDQKWGDTAPFSHQTEETGARFSPKSKLRDPIFLLLFIANLAGWAVVSAIAIKEFVKVGGLGGGMGNSTGSAVTLD